MKKMFTSDKFFLAMVLCAVVCNVIYTVLSIVVYNRAVGPKLQLLLRILCVVCLYVSYCRHSKNVMKGLMGALLMAQLTTATNMLSNMSTIFPINKFTVPVFAGLSLLLLINHLIINSDRHSSPVMIRINQVLLILLVVNQAIWSTYIILSDFSALCLIRQICNFVGFTGMHAVVVCVESRLDAYRLDREAAGWTEEKGYPEGYVHEYEKNNKS